MGELNRYVVTLDGLERWLHESTSGRAGVLSLFQGDVAVLSKALRPGAKPEPYVAVRFGMNARVLTMEEHIASKSTQPVFGMEDWYAAGTPLEAAPPQPPALYSSSKLLPAAYSEPPARVSDARRSAKRRRGAKAAVLDVVRATPGIQLWEVAKLVYGNAMPGAVQRARAQLSLLIHKDRKVERFNDGYRLKDGD
jgi:hypothetical protein